MNASAGIASFEHASSGRLTHMARTQAAQGKKDDDQRRDALNGARGDCCTASKGRYRADITAGSLKINESRVIADLLLRGVDEAGWRQAITKENVLKAKNPATATRLARLIRQRLEAMSPELWRMVRDGTVVVTAHAVLAAAIKHSPLLGDFLDLAVRDQYRRFGKALSKKGWLDFLEDCRGRDPHMPQWHESTVRRMGSSVFQILAQAGYIKDTRSMLLQRPSITSEVVGYLKRNKEDYVLRCITAGT